MLKLLEFYAVTHRANWLNCLVPLIKKILDDIIGTQQRACEATLKYKYQNIHISFIYAFFFFFFFF